LREEGQTELSERRLADLARVQSCAPLADSVNPVFANRRFQFHKHLQPIVGMHN